MTMRNMPPLPVLPHIEIRWTQAVLSGTFDVYNVYRRLAGATDWVCIARIADVTTLVYRDYAVTSRETWEYAVTQTEVIGIDSLESAKPTPVRARVVFDWTYLHPVHDAPSYVPFYTVDISEQVQQDIEYRAAWGRQQPTAFVGDADFSRLQLLGLSDVHRGYVWERLRAAVSLQRTDAAVYCLRVGIDSRRWFVNVSIASRRLGQGSSDPTIELSEVFYDEAV